MIRHHAADALAYAMTALDPRLPPYPPSDPVLVARLDRRFLATLISEGSTDLMVLLDYRRVLATSRLLGDISEEEAKTSFDRACSVILANVEHAAQPLMSRIRPKPTTYP